MDNECGSQAVKMVAGSGARRWFQWFLISAGVILMFTGAAKVWSAFGHATLLTLGDPLFDIPFRYLLLVAGVLEIAIGCNCFFAKNRVFATGLVAYLATTLLIYRLGLWWSHWHSPCPCLGNLTDALHIPPQTADTVMKIVLCYLLFFSYGVLWWAKRQKKGIMAPAK